MPYGGGLLRDLRFATGIFFEAVEGLLKQKPFPEKEKSGGRGKASEKPLPKVTIHKKKPEGAWLKSRKFFHPGRGGCPGRDPLNAMNRLCMVEFCTCVERT